MATQAIKLAAIPPRRPPMTHDPVPVQAAQAIRAKADRQLASARGKPDEDERQRQA